MSPTTGHAHGVRLPFAQWGGFEPGAVRCQRGIARAAAGCAAAAWRLRRACLEAEVGGLTCDEPATTAQIMAVRRAALDDVDGQCSERQAIDLQYLGSFDLQADVTNFCRAWEIAAASAAFGPLLDDAGRLEPDAARCADAAADAATDVMRLIFRIRRDQMDRLAAAALASPKRQTWLEAAGWRVNATAEAVASRLAARCPAQRFASLYGRSPAAYVSGLASRADCIGGAFYIQDAVLCPPAVCGNGILEPEERCDDGNTAAGDACPPDCR